MKKVRCPRCGDLDKTRIHRAWWMRLIPLSRRYECDACGHHFLSVRTSLIADLPKLFK